MLESAGATARNEARQGPMEMSEEIGWQLTNLWRQKEKNDRN